jgi:hemolysin activation/secretion protein
VANAKRENEAKAKAQAEAKAKAEAEAKAKSEAKAKDNAEKQKKAEIAAAKAKEQIIPESAKVATNVFHEGDGVISILEGDGSVLSGQLKPSLGQTVAIFKDGKRVADAQVTHVSILSTYGKITKLYVKSLDSYLIGDKVAVKNVVAAVPEASVVHAEIKPEPKIEPKPERAEAAASDAKVTVNGIKFSGNSVVETADLERVADKKRSGEMSLAEMRAIADSVAEYYRAQGYFLAKAVIPEQDIAGGIVNIEVLEGKLGKVHILGAAYYSEEYLQAFFNHIRKQGVIRKNNLERALLIMNSLPGLKVTSALKAGEQKGTTDIVVTVEEGDRLLATLEMDNFGSRYARVRALAGLDFISPLRRGDACSLSGLSGISSDKLYYFTANCSIPVDANGTSIGFYGLTGDFGVGREFAALNIQGEASAVGASVNRVLKINKNGSSVGELGLDAKKSRQDVLGAVSSEDSIVSLRLTMKNNVTDRSGRTFVGATIQHGLGEALGGMDDKDPMSSRAAGGGRTTVSLR